MEKDIPSRGLSKEQLIVLIVAVNCVDSTQAAKQA